jgi:hypothetical protein
VFGNSIPILARINKSTARWIAVHIPPTVRPDGEEISHSYLR